MTIYTITSDFYIPSITVNKNVQPLLIVNVITVYVLMFLVVTDII